MSDTTGTINIHNDCIERLFLLFVPLHVDDSRIFYIFFMYHFFSVRNGSPALLCCLKPETRARRRRSHCLNGS